MRSAILASVTLHLGLIAGAWLLMQSSPEDMSAAEAAVSIDIISMEDAVAEPSETVSEATASLVSAGMTQVPQEPVEIEAAEPVEVAEAQPVEAATVQPATVTEPFEPMQTEALVSAEVMTTPTQVEAPIPAPRPVRKPVDAEANPVEKQTPVEKKPETPVEKKKTKQVASLGSGGENEADSAASKAAGGKPGKVSAEGGNSAVYAGKVRAKVIKALKRPSGSYDPGEARVSFTIDATGRLISVRISGSSGDAKVDKAVVAAVERAAPFPSFTEGGPRAFTFPLMIQ